MLAPAGNFPSPARILSAQARFRQTGSGALVEQVAELEQQLSEYLSIKNSLAFGSGREALLAALLVLREERGITNLAISAFTCPEIVASAARAGFKVDLLDVDAESLEPLHEEIGKLPGNSVVLLSNLFGLVDRLPLNMKDGCFLVDDACQASLSKSSGKSIGARGDLGLVSFGRGKPLCGVGGGALLFSSELEIQFKRFREQRQILWGGSPERNAMSSWIKAGLGWALERPRLYWIPASVPFLKLGASSFSKDFSVSPPSLVELSAAAACIEDATETTQQYLKRKKLWHGALSGLGLVEPVVARGQLDDDEVVLTRYPLVFPTREWRECAASELHQAGLGVSRSYNRAVLEYDGIESYIAMSSSAQGSSIATRLITLPMHRYVAETHIEQAVEIIRSSKP